MKRFCDKYGKECPYSTPQAQSYNCDAWDPRELLADKTCRHALTVDNMELAKKQWLAANKIGPRNKKRIETPERNPVIMNKDGEIDAKQTAILQRLELEKRQTAALERLADTFEKVGAEIADIAEHFGEQIAKIIDTLEPLARFFREDEWADTGDEEAGDDE